MNKCQVYGCEEHTAAVHKFIDTELPICSGHLAAVHLFCRGLTEEITAANTEYIKRYFDFLEAGAKKQKEEIK